VIRLSRPGHWTSAPALCSQSELTTHLSPRKELTSQAVTDIRRGPGPSPIWSNTLLDSIIIDTIHGVSKTAKIVEQMRRSPQNVRFDDLAKVCADHFGEPRQEGTSHKVYKTPWQGDPRVNIQRGKDGNAKAYQVRQVLDAIARLEAEKTEEGDDDA
jgi:hypothetical protein